MIRPAILVLMGTLVAWLGSTWLGSTWLGSTWPGSMPAATAAADEPGALPAPPDASLASVRTAIDRGVAFLLRDQNDDGSWGSYREPRPPENLHWSNPGTHRAWTAGTTGIVCTTLMNLGESASSETRDALLRGLDFLIEEGLVERVSEWDVDNTWGYVYGLEAVARALRHGPIRGTPRQAKLRELGDAILERLRRHQTPDGGWGYYDDPPYTRRPKWATSFMTAAAILALVDAREAGLEFPDRMLERSTRAVLHSRLPTGAYTYSVTAVPSPGGLTGINQVKGSLGRIQVGNLALYETARSETASVEIGAPLDRHDLRRGLDQFFEHHRFLAIGRGRPIPHEAYYAVAGYFFFFGHHYAARVIEALPPDEREPYWRQMREKILECQEADGSMWDFHSHRYHRPQGTAWGIDVLRRSLDSGA